MNRETYLNKAVECIKPLFEAQGYTLPPVKVSCSWPGGRGNKNSTIGQCWNRAASSAGINEIYISPTIEESVRCLDILVHELIHAIDDNQHGHRKEFTAIMRAIGLEGKPTSTHAGERLNNELQSIVDSIGEYPHAAVTPSLAGKKKQTTRMIKIECMACSAVWRMSRTHAERVNQCCVCCSTDISIQS